YNPAHEDQTHVTGGAQLFIPASAGLRLNVHAALGAGIPIVSAQAGLELGGSLAVEGAVVAAVHVDWTPRRGLVLDASGEIYAEPKLKFDVTGFVTSKATWRRPARSTRRHWSAIPTTPPRTTTWDTCARSKAGGTTQSGTMSAP